MPSSFSRIAQPLGLLTVAALLVFLVARAIATELDSWLIGLMGAGLAALVAVLLSAGSLRRTNSERG